MNSIDVDVVEATIVKAFKELRTAVDMYNVTSVETYSLALRVLVDLRRQAIAEREAA